MAHGDYACCCICASKMDYEGFSENHKKRLCASCAIGLMKHGVEATTSDDVLAWLKRTPVEGVVPVLRAIGFDLCYYDNEIDAQVASLCGKTDYRGRWASPQAMIRETLSSLLPPASPRGTESDTP